MEGRVCDVRLGQRGESSYRMSGRGMRCFDETAGIISMLVVMIRQSLDYVFEISSIRKTMIFEL